ncbi:MAG: PIN domain-containing protein [Synergistaceae bacterium]|jgi:tRNA(fMet)-specific endonuclease VapC|nr:PIN domain-containing protein [Synergistaceae bacterium]
MNYLLDTSICIYFLRQHPQVIRHIQQYDVEDLAISIITLAELLFGAYNSSQIENNINRIKFITERTRLLDLTPKATGIYAEIKAILRKSGNIIDDLDIFIGATAIENNLTLVTDNGQHFSRIKGLRIANWIA